MKKKHFFLYYWKYFKNCAQMLKKLILIYNLNIKLIVRYL